MGLVGVVGALECKWLVSRWWSAAAEDTGEGHFELADGRADPIIDRRTHDNKIL